MLLGKDTDLGRDRPVQVTVMITFGKILSIIDAIRGMLDWADKLETPEHDRIL